MTGTREQHVHAVRLQVRAGTYKITRATLLTAVARLLAKMDKSRPAEAGGTKETTC
jgi:hypothetical protein